MSAAAGTRASYREALGFGAANFALMLVLGVGSSIAVARLYGAAVIGEFALASAPYLTLIYLSTLQEQAALVRELAALQPRAPRATGLFAAVLAFSFTLTVVIAVPVAVASYFLFAGPIGHRSLIGPAAALLVAYVVLLNTSWNFDMLFTSFRAGRALFWIRLLQAIVYLLLAVVVGVVSPTVWSLVAATAISWGTALVHRSVLVHPLVRARVSREEIRSGFSTLPELIRFGAKIAPGQVANGLSIQSATWVLGAFVPVAALGAFSRAWMLGSRLQDASTRVTEMLFPTLVERRASGDVAGFERSLVDSLRYSVFAMLFVAAAAGGAARGVMGLFGPGFEQGATAFAIVIAVPTLVTVTAIANVVLYALGRPLVTSGIAIGRLVLTIGLVVALSRVGGISGAALGLAGGYLAGVALSAACLSGELAGPFRRLWPLRQFFALPVAYAVGFVVARAIDESVRSVAGLLAALTAGSFAYIAVALVAGGFAERDRERAGDVVAALQARWFRRSGVSGERGSR